MKTTSANRFLIAGFLALLVAVPWSQALVEWRSGGRVKALALFHRMPTSANLRAYERELEDACVVARRIRPWLQAAQFFLLREAGGKVLVGRENWLFYGPGVAYLTQRPRPQDATWREALVAIIDYRDQLAARGLQLLLVPVPNKESVYPDRFSWFARPPANVIGRETTELMRACEQAGVEVLDLFAVYRAARATLPEPLYLAQDTHWSPTGMKLAAEAVARRLLEKGWTRPGDTPSQIRPLHGLQEGDLVEMLRCPMISDFLDAEVIAGEAVEWEHPPSSPGEVLVLGDSFVGIYERGEEGRAGFVAHVSHALAQQADCIQMDGGASTLVRQELVRRRDSIEHAKVVVWEFSERDIRLGAEGWQKVPLPAAKAAATSNDRK